MSWAVPCIPCSFAIQWHGLLGLDPVIIGGVIAFLVCNMVIQRSRGSPKVIILALEGVFAYETPTRPPLMYMDR